MLPPVLEVIIIHHPRDSAGAAFACEVFEHFHGTSFTGLIGGAVEVYVRSQPWIDGSGAPRPITFPNDPPLIDAVPPAELIAVVPVISLELVRAVQYDSGWADYFERIVRAQADDPDRVGVFPLSIEPVQCSGTRLYSILGKYQQIAVPPKLREPEPLKELRCRDLVQGITQLIRGEDSRLQVFISHTCHPGTDEEDVLPLIRLVQDIIAETRLQHFFDANDLQPGRDWADTLHREAKRSALIAIRTDLYASRRWCQREMLIAKYAGMPIVILDSLGKGEERGSFLMDHVPRVPVREVEGRWEKAEIRRGLNLLVDECLKRALWDVQERLASELQGLEVAWWAPHAPETITLAHWLTESDERKSLLGSGDLRILHPDPPLSHEELVALRDMVALMGHEGAFDVMTPRALSARGGL